MLVYSGYVISSATHIKGDTIEMGDINDLSHHIHPEHLIPSKRSDIADDARFNDLFRAVRGRSAEQERLD